MAAQIINWFIPAALLLGMVDLLKRFLNCCNVAFVPMTATIATTLLHPLWVWLFFDCLDIGVVGIPIALFVTYGA